MSERKDLRVEFRFKNAPLHNALEERFAETAKLLGRQGFQGVAADAIGIRLITLNGALNLRESPYSRDGTLRPWARKVADFLEQEPGRLFSLELYLQKFPRLASVDTNPVQFLELAAAKDVATSETPLTLLLEGEQSESSRVLESALGTLKPREARILRQRFGLDGETHTYEEIAQQEGVTRERIRQIENRGLRSLRHPSRSRALRQYA